VLFTRIWLRSGEKGEKGDRSLFSLLGHRRPSRYIAISKKGTHEPFDREVSTNCESVLEIKYELGQTWEIRAGGRKINCNCIGDHAYDIQQLCGPEVERGRDGMDSL
jgi:hypothetical protein